MCEFAVFLAAQLQLQKDGKMSLRQQHQQAGIAVRSEKQAYQNLNLSSLFLSSLKLPISY